MIRDGHFGNESIQDCTLRIINGTMVWDEHFKMSLSGWYFKQSILYQWYNGTGWTLWNESIQDDTLRIINGTMVWDEHFKMSLSGWYFKQSILYQWYNGTGWTLWNESIQDDTLRIIPTCPFCTNGTMVWDGHLRMSIQDGTLRIIPTCPSCIQDGHLLYDVS